MDESHEVDVDTPCTKFTRDYNIIAAFDLK